MKVTIYKNESIFFKTWVAHFDIDFFTVNNASLYFPYLQIKEQFETQTL